MAVILTSGAVLINLNNEVSASTRPSLADLQAQLTSLQNQVGSLSPGDPFIGEVRLFSGNFAPRGWAFCQGQLLSIAQNQALYSILGNTYGGDGITTFALPDLRGRVAMGEGNGPGLTNRSLGQKPGVENTVLSTSQLPQHSHTLLTSSAGTNTTQASGNLLAADSANAIYKTNGSGDTQTGTDSITSTGANQPVSVVQPSQVLNYIIAIEGLYPQRN